jgi:hypothetical protein
MGSLTPGTQTALDRLSATARAVIARVPAVLPAYRGPVQTEPMLWTWTGYTRKDRRGHRPPQTPADVALCAQRRADRARMMADRAACIVHSVNKPREKV